MAGLSALALFGFLFLDWFGAIEVEGVYFNRAVHATSYAASFSSSGGSGWDVLGWAALAACIVAIVAGLALPLLAARNESPVLPVVGSIAASLLGWLAIVALIIQVIAQPGPDELVEVKSGWWLGLIASFGIAAGGWMAMKDETTPVARKRPIEVRPAPPVA